MIKRGISPFIFQTCLNTHRPAPEPRTAGWELPPRAGVPWDAHPKPGGESAGPGSPSWIQFHAITSGFVPLSPPPRIDHHQTTSFSTLFFEGEGSIDSSFPDKKYRIDFQPLPRAIG